MKGIPITLEIAAVTDIGQRRMRNEDNFFVNGAFIDHYKVTAERFETVDTEEVHVLAVCDGMGGQQPICVLSSSAVCGPITRSNLCMMNSIRASLKELPA